MYKHNIKTTFLRLSRFASYIMKRGLSRNHSGFLVVRLQGAAVVVVSRQGCFLFFCCHVFFLELTTVGLGAVFGFSPAHLHPCGGHQASLSVASALKLCSVLIVSHFVLV